MKSTPASHHPTPDRSQEDEAAVHCTGKTNLHRHLPVFCQPARDISPARLASGAEAPPGWLLYFGRGLGAGRVREVVPMSFASFGPLPKPQPNPIPASPSNPLSNPVGEGRGEASALWQAVALLLAEIDPDVRGYVWQVFVDTLEAA